MMIYEGWITVSSATKDGGGFLKFKSRWCFWRLAKEIWKIETTKQKKRKFTKINMFTKLIQSWRGNTENAYPFFLFYRMDGKFNSKNTEGDNMEPVHKKSISLNVNGLWDVVPRLDHYRFVSFKFCSKFESCE